MTKRRFAGRRAMRVLAAVAATASVAGSTMLSVDVSGASGAALKKVACTTSPTDPQIAAPLYAQDNGASAKSDGWWCQLPHATKIPTTLIQRRRILLPVDNTTYEQLLTWYAASPKTATATRTASPDGTIPGITVSDLASAQATAPTHLQHGEAVNGRRVRIGKGVWGIETQSGKTVRIAFRYPAKGVPKYLTSVATVFVAGTTEPVAEVLAVARNIRPI